MKTTKHTEIKTSQPGTSLDRIWERCSRTQNTKTVQRQSPEHAPRDRTGSRIKNKKKKGTDNQRQETTDWVRGKRMNVVAREITVLTSSQSCSLKETAGDLR